ncbi:AAA family ATPase [Patescibacteria group bacterium]|nr:AAA family ATPase [Patescibacteria group bacterium]
MKIQKIQNIQGYKSFQNYTWHTFCNSETFHTKTNLLYGENGSGKSSLCNILKSVSQNKDFIRYSPKSVKIQIDSASYEYTSNNWISRIDKDSILFFDREFVDSNVHLGRDRGTQQDQQEQKSAKLIIEFDAEAIKLRTERDRLIQIKNVRNSKFDEYREENRSILDFNLTNEEEISYKKYKNRDKVGVDKAKKKIEDEKNELTVRTKRNRKLLESVNEIQQIQELENNPVNLLLSKQAVYQALFTFKIREKTKIQAEQELVDKIRQHKDFFETGIEIRDVHPKRCPFCQSTRNEGDIKKIISAYSYLYDESYKQQISAFESVKQELIDELDLIQKTIRNIELDTFFLALKNLSDKYSIKNIYLLQEERQFRKNIELTKISELKKKIQNLTKPNKEDISAIYKEARKEFEVAKKTFDDFAKLTQKKNKLIVSFKSDHTDEKLVGRIDTGERLLSKLEIELDFIRSNKIDREKLRRQKRKELDRHQKKFEKAKSEYILIRDKYEEYCSTEAFTKTLSKIESYFNYFNFSFKLLLDTQNRHTGSTKELPFAFKVIDLEGNERDLREGMSEGEVQVLSLCFFFAFLDIQADKNQKILVFDDPITSLDDSNLSNLVDLLAIEKDKFSQAFIFTHHRTFFKFLRKRFKDKCCEFNLIRNKKHLGGSFICKSQEERFTQKLKDFETHLTQIAQNPHGFDIELKIVEYGQYLRYETEYFIKCRLLHWNESSEFGKVVEGIKENKKVTDADLDKIKQIYSFCNWTTSHVDVGDDHGLAQLKEKVADFVVINNKY